MANAKLNRRASLLRLVQSNTKPNAGVVEALETLLALARQGDIQGIAFAADLPDGDFITDIIGSCFSKPTLARGMLAFLADQAAGLQHQLRATEAR